MKKSFARARIDEPSGSVLNRDKIVRKLRESGMRITKQRMIIIDVILENNCATCKEIYYQALRRDSGIGLATVYRMINAMNDLGIMMPSSLKPREDIEVAGNGHGCRILLGNDKTVDLSQNEFMDILREEIVRRGYNGSDRIEKVILQ